MEMFDLGFVMVFNTESSFLYYQLLANHDLA